MQLKAFGRLYLKISGIAGSEEDEASMRDGGQNWVPTTTGTIWDLPLALGAAEFQLPFFDIDSDLFRHETVWLVTI